MKRGGTLLHRDLERRKAELRDSSRRIIAGAGLMH
jgi:hypothetical protein